MPPIDKSKPNMSKTARFQLDLKKAALPGPGHYQENQEFGVNNVTGGNSKKGYSMRARTNLENKKLHVPGPGQYELKPLLGQSNVTSASSPKKTFSSHLNNSYMSQTSRGPGPGTYSLNLSPIKKNGPSFSMRVKTERLGFKRLDGPGPANYNPIHKLSTKRSVPSFTMRKRTNDLSQGKNISPGPSYDLSQHNNTKKRAPAFSMRPKNNVDKLKHVANTPAPDAYNPSLHYVHTRAPNEARAIRHSVSLPQLSRAY